MKNMAQPLLKKIITGQFFADQQLFGIHTINLIKDAIFIDGIFNFKTGSFKFAGRNIRIAKAPFRFRAVKRGQIIATAFRQQCRFQNRTGTDNTNNIPFYQSLCQLWIFHLFTDRNTITFCDQFCNIIVYRMVRNTAHRDLAFCSGTFLCQYQIQLFRSNNCIVTEHFIEIAHAEEQDRFRMLSLDLPELFHHWCFFCHRFRPLSNLTRFSNRSNVRNLHQSNLLHR